MTVIKVGFGLEDVGERAKLYSAKCLEVQKAIERESNKNNDDLNKMIELINSVKARNIDSEIELIGSKESFDKLTEIGFDLNCVKHHEFKIDESKIFIIPAKPKPIKVYFAGEDKYEG